MSTTSRIQYEEPQGFPFVRVDQFETARLLDNWGTAVGLVAFAPYAFGVLSASVRSMLVAVIVAFLAVILKGTALVLTRLTENRFYNSTRVDSILPASYRDNDNTWEGVVVGR